MFISVLHLCLSGMWLVVAPRTNILKKCVCFKDNRLHAHNMTNIPNSYSQHNWEDLYDHLVSMVVFLC